MKTIELLKKKEQELRRKIDENEEKRSQKLLPKYRKQFVGKCFKYKNSYGSGSNPWWLYIKIIDVQSVNFYNNEEPVFKTIQIQLCEGGRIELETREHAYVSEHEYIPVNQTEFDKEAHRIIEKAKELLKG